MAFSQMFNHSPPTLRLMCNSELFFFILVAIKAVPAEDSCSRRRPGESDSWSTQPTLLLTRQLPWHVNSASSHCSVTR